MKNALLHILFIALLVTSCGTCSQLQQRDNALTFSFESLRNQYLAGGLPREAYIFELRKLREKELKLFEDARQCEFKDQQKENYWKRSRLKFPSRIQQELERLVPTALDPENQDEPGRT